MGKTFAIVGAGQMGAGIAQVAAQAGMNVLLNDVGMERAQAGKAGIQKSLTRLLEKGKIDGENMKQVLELIQPVGDFADLAAADFIVEAATERVELKYQIFRKLDEVAKPGVILASNTSSISITAIAAQTKRPAEVVGMHFMNPVPVMKLVEGIRGLRTSDATFAEMRSLAVAMGKTVVEARDYPGFAVNRILMPMINEAVYALYEGVASIEDIDISMKLGTNQPMGPFTLADFIGLDTCLAIMNVLHDGLGDSKYRPCPLLKQYVDAGLHGKKTGIGFYDYRSGEAKPTKPGAF
jgi:3-hydroxybutyryl-CoA dehydrogenase